jgi:hypothetical protein
MFFSLMMFVVVSKKCRKISNFSAKIFLFSPQKCSSTGSLAKNTSEIGSPPTAFVVGNA